MEYKEQIINYRNNFIRDYGSIKYNEIFEKISYSKHLQRGIRISKSKNSPLLAGDFLQIGAAHSGIFGKKSTRIMGALLAFELWNEELNSEYELASSGELNTEIRKCLRGY
ncbi:hypothetical protein [Lutibacter sp.]|uniref:hypothetical protein n=1 Tax=Lutibacter sp. TaxID=1925666 RepID=UPI0035662D1A